MSEREIVIRLRIPWRPRLFAFIAIIAGGAVAYAAASYPPTIPTFAAGNQVKAGDFTTAFQNLSADLVDLDARAKTLASPLGISYALSTNQTLTEAQNNTINFDQLVFDNSAAFNGGTSAVTTGANWSFVAPIAGRYRIDVTLRYNTPAANAGNGVQLFLGNHELDLYNFTATVSTGAQFDLHGSAMVSLHVGDPLSVIINENTNANAAVLSGPSRIDINWIGT